MFGNEYIAQQLYKARQMELQPRTINIVVREIISEYKDRTRRNITRKPRR